MAAGGPASEGGRAADGRLHFGLQFEAVPTRPEKIGQGRGPGVICDQPLGATLGATRLNELVVLRTDVNSGQRVMTWLGACGPGRGGDLIRKKFATLEKRLGALRLRQALGH